MPDFFGEGSFPAWLTGKPIHFQSGRTVTKVRLNREGRGDNETVEFAISTSTNGTSWNDWEYLAPGVILELVNPGPYLRVQVSGSQGTVFNSKDARGVNEGAEIEIIETL